MTALYTPPFYTSSTRGRVFEEACYFLSQKLCSYAVSFSRMRQYALLAFSWIIGLLSGILTYLCVADLVSPIMDNVVYAVASISDIFCISLLPFLVSAFAVYLSASVILYVVCFGKAFLTTFFSTGILHVYGSSGWIVLRFMLFSQYIVMPILYFFWLRNLRHMRGAGVENICWLVCFAAICMGIASIDFCIISPFWVRVIDF